MDYRSIFQDAVDQLHAEKRYRVFANLERIVGKFPRAIHRSGATAREVTVWCSNDYLGMGQNDQVIEALCEAAGKMGSGAGGTRNISGTNHPLVELEHELANPVVGAGIGGRLICRSRRDGENDTDDCEREREDAERDKHLDQCNGGAGTRRGRASALVCATNVSSQLAHGTIGTRM